MTKAERLHAAACPKWAHDPKLDTAAFDYLFGDKDGVTTESFDPCVTEIAEKLSRRENVTLVTLGQPRSGKSYAMHHILHRVVKKLADHIESSCELWDDHMANVVPLSSMRMSYDMSGITSISSGNGRNASSCKVNGDPLSVRIGCADGPVDFSNWKQQGTIGGRLEFDDPVALRDPFAGVVSELLIYEPVSRKDHELSNVIAYYPLESADARDVSGRAGPVEVTVDIEIEKCEDEFPYTAYKLNGHNTFVNVGQLGDFGCALNAFSVEIWLKTTETKKTMTMLGVTDTSHKHAGFGIDLNTSAFGRLVPHRTTCWVRDCSSHTYAASFEAAELFDGKWHCLRWHVYDAHLGKVKIEIDQHPYDIELSNPKPGKYPEFVPFTQWVCIGAQNNRGMVEKHFCGSVREAKLWKLAKDKRLIAHWPLNEGPGARIAVDVTGNGNGGIYFLGKKKMGQWECDKGLLRLANVMSGPRPVQQETERAGAPPLVKKYRNNRLQIACVAFGADPDESGAYKEVRYDVMHGDFFEDMDRVPLSEQPDISHRYPVDAASSLEVSALPAACFEPIKLATYKKLFIDLASRLQEDDLRACHTAFVLKLGDACFVGFDLMGQQLNRKTATFNPQHLTWVDAVATMGAIGRRRVAINKAVQAVQHGLMEIGSLPQLVKRCSTKSASVRQSIENAFIGTEMSLFVRSCLSYGDSPSSVYVLTTMLRHPTRDEYIASIAFAQAMHHRTQHWAALMIQKSMRAFLARARAALLSSARDNVRERLNHRSIARKSMPDFTETRSKKVAILVSASQLRHTAVARHPQATASVAALESILTKLGYQVHLFSYDSPGAAGPPEKTAVLNCIKRYSNQHDAEVFVYISAYGATGSFPRPVKAAKFCAWLTPWESDERDVLEETEKKARLALHKSEEVDQRDAVDAAQQREVEIQRKAARQKKRRQSQSVASTRAHDMKKQSVALHSDSQSRRSADTRSDRKSQRSDASPCVTAAAVDDIAPVTPRDSTVLRSSSIDIAPSMVSDDETDDVYSKYSTIATQYLIPSDAPRDIPADSVWFVDQLEDAVLGDKPILGRHAVLCFEARSISTVPSATNLAPAMHGSDVHSFASVLGSSRQGLSLTYGGGQCGALSHYLIKGLQGAAMYEAGGDDNGVIGIERLLAYLTKKLKKWSFNFVSEPFGTYVGEIAFAQQALVAKGSIAAIKLKEKHRKFKVQVRYHIDGRTCITEQLASRIHTHLNMVTKGQSSVDVKLVEVDPCISLFFRSSNDFEEATQNPALEQRWSKDVSSLMAGYRGPLKYTYSFGSHAGAFCLAVFPDTSRVTAARKAADQTALDRKEKVAAEQVRILEFIEYVRKEAAMSLDSGGGLALCGREVTAVAASATAVVAVASNASVEKISLGSCLSNKLIIQHFKESIKESVDTMKVKLDVEEGITLIGARQFTEQEEKDHAKWELEITIEQKRRAAVAKEARLAHIAAQKREEDEKLRLQKKKQSVLDWLKENDTGMMNAIDEPVLAMLFSVHEVDVLEASLKYISDVAKQGDKSATMLARYGIVDQVVLVLEGFSKENALVSLSLDVLSTVSRAPPPEKPGSRERQSSRTNSDAKPLEMKHRSSSEKLDSSLSKRKSRQVSLGGTRSSGSSVESPRVSEMVVNKMASVKEHALRLIRAIVDEEPTLPEADRVLGQLDDPLNAGIVDAVLHVVSASKNQAAVVVPGLFALRALLACGLKPPSFNKMASVIIDSEQAISSSSADDAVAVAITLLHDARGVRAASVDEAEICAQLKAGYGAVLRARSCERVFEAGGRVYKDAISRWPKRFVLSAMGLASATTGAIALQTLGIYDFGFAWMDAEMPTCRKTWYAAAAQRVPRLQTRSNVSRARSVRSVASVEVTEETSKETKAKDKATNEDPEEKHEGADEKKAKASDRSKSPEKPKKGLFGRLFAKKEASARSRSGSPDDSEPSEPKKSRERKKSTSSQAPRDDASSDTSSAEAQPTRKPSLGVAASPRLAATPTTGARGRGGGLDLSRAPSLSGFNKQPSFLGTPLLRKQVSLPGTPVTGGRGGGLGPAVLAGLTSSLAQSMLHSSARSMGVASVASGGFDQDAYIPGKAVFIKAGSNGCPPARDPLKRLYNALTKDRGTLSCTALVHHLQDIGSKNGLVNEEAEEALKMPIDTFVQFLVKSRSPSKHIDHNEFMQLAAEACRENERARELKLQEDEQKRLRHQEAEQKRLKRQGDAQNRSNTVQQENKQLGGDEEAKKREESEQRKREQQRAQDAAAALQAAEVVRLQLEEQSKRHQQQVRESQLQGFLQSLQDEETAARLDKEDAERATRASAKDRFDDNLRSVHALLQQKHEITAAKQELLALHQQFTSLKSDRIAPPGPSGPSHGHEAAQDGKARRHQSRSSVVSAVSSSSSANNAPEKPPAKLVKSRVKKEAKPGPQRQSHSPDQLWADFTSALLERGASVAELSHATEDQLLSILTDTLGFSKLDGLRVVKQFLEKFADVREAHAPAISPKLGSSKRVPQTPPQPTLDANYSADSVAMDYNYVDMSGETRKATKYALNDPSRVIPRYLVSLLVTESHSNKRTVMLSPTTHSGVSMLPREVSALSPGSPLVSGRALNQLHNIFQGISPSHVVSRSSGPVMCPLHPGEELQLYCVDDEELTCTMCASVGRHSGKKCQPLSELLQGMRSHLAVHEKQVSNKLARVEAGLNQLQKQADTVRDAEIRARRQIRQRTNELIEEVSGRREALEHDLTTKAVDAGAKVQEAIRHGLEHAVSLRQAHEKIKTLVDDPYSKSHGIS
eukprot:gene23156-35478_t